jgi:hypothetical protein
MSARHSLKSAVDTAGHPLDNPAWASLTGPHAHFAQGTERARRYPADVSPILAIGPSPDDQSWAELLALVGPDSVVALAGETSGIPSGWTIEFQGAGLQLVASERLHS